MKKQLMNITLAAALVGAPSAFAADLNGYVGASGGQTKAKDADSASELDAQNARDGYTTRSSVDDTDTGWKLFAGYKFNRNFAVEGSYADLGEASANSVVSASPYGTGTVSQQFEAKTLAVAAVGILPLANYFNVFGKAGFHYWDAEWSVTSTLTGLSGKASEDDNGTDLMYGVGAGFNVTNNLALRAEWEIYTNIGDENTTGETDVEMWSAGLQYNF